MSSPAPPPAAAPAPGARPPLRVPHVMALLTIVVAVMSAASWLIPSGSYVRETVKVGALTKQLVVPGSYAALDKVRTLGGLLLPPAELGAGEAAPVSLLGFLSAIPRGLEQSADIIFFIFMMGGVFGILQATGAITAALGRLTELFAERVGVLVVLLGLLMGIGGSTLGMGEEFIPLVPMFLMLSQRLGYDRVFGLSIVVLAPGIGFAAATTNPFTVNIAQKIAELPLNSGWELRVVFFAVCMALTLGHILRYGARVRRDPAASVVHGIPDPAGLDLGEVPALNGRHIGILAMCGLLFAGIMVAVQTEGWWLAEMGGGFFLMGILAAVIAGMSLDRATRAFTHGMSEMVVAALVVGFARGIVVVMTDAQILDTIVHAAAGLLDGQSRHVAVQGMLLFQSLLNVFVPSGSGQAAVTMPLMAPLADLLGITRQTAVLAYQCGDGFSNMVIPTSGTLMAMLLMAGVPYDRWLRFALPLVGVLLLTSAVFLGIAVSISYQ